MMSDMPQGAGLNAVGTQAANLASLPIEEYNRAVQSDPPPNPTSH